tara:strand:+ start:553 stop:1098 length:546 start_codon:yes stop_codon:yes gene_type:complete
MFEDFNTSMYYKKNPPANGSFTTMQEIKELKKIPINRKFIKDKDNTLDVFKKASEKINIVIPEELINKLIKESAPVIMDLKEFFNRPRPKDIAIKLGISLPNVELESMKTPSYPSGHSTQAYLVAHVLSDIYPKYKEIFIKAANDISYSRNVARCHYRSDSKFGKFLGKEMYNYLKQNYGV